MGKIEQKNQKNFEKSHTPKKLTTTTSQRNRYFIQESEHISNIIIYILIYLLDVRTESQRESFIFEIDNNALFSQLFT